MTWSVKTPYAMFHTWGGQKHMVAHHESVLDKNQMIELWETGAPLVAHGMECEKFDFRDMDLEFCYSGREGSYDFFWFENIRDHVIYPMFVSDAAELLKQDVLRRQLSGTFKMVRHGAHYGIVLE